MLFFTTIFVIIFKFLFVQSCTDFQKNSFGGCGPFQSIDSIDKFPEGEKFFKSYVEKNIPLKMKAAAVIYPAYRLWTDEYFKSISELGNEYVIVEGEKIENRTKPFLNVSFHEFLQMYNHSNNYLVSSLPKPLM